uniref:non-specific serine/threonine protein kinase n=1 Tax=Oryza nivara TaxID=4536 RepID=A0A0E0HG01_ORYNI
MKPIAISALNSETGKKSCTSEAPFSGPTTCISSERNQEPPNLHNLNAFDIISLSTGFNRSGLFGESILVKTESYSPGNAEICANRSVLMERYEIGRQLGQGTFGKVYYARNLSFGHSVAIKMIDKEIIMKVSLVEQIKREISIMRLVRHPNILQLFEVMATNSKIYFALEYAKSGKLFHKMARAKLNEESARKKITKAEYRCPRHFSAELKELLYGILDPDPSTRMSILRIKISAWYKKPIAISALNSETRKKSCISEAPFSGPTTCISSERNQEPPNLHNLNAFYIISLYTGFDLSGLFGERYGWREARFSSILPAAAILVKLKEPAKSLNLKGRLKLDAEVSEVAPSFLLVELKKTNGDTLEYHRLMKEDIRPSLKDIIWTWQGDQQ